MGEVEQRIFRGVQKARAGQTGMRAGVVAEVGEGRVKVSSWMGWSLCGCLRMV